jgi:xanthine dehydrogenase YagT iron-sulfur-binding subunit
MKPITRRSFLEQSGTGIAVASAIPAVGMAGPQDASSPDPSAAQSQVHLKVNGQDHRLEVEDRWTLAEVLRDHLELTGTRLGCDRGECGACTVLLDGKNVYSCSYLAVWADGKNITTVEGLANGEELDPLQQSFITHDGPQCGFCTSGQLMSARALLNENPHPTEMEARLALAVNICRFSN